MLPPSARGTISYLAPKGQYTVDVSSMRIYISSKGWRCSLYSILGCCPWSWIWRWNYKVHHEATLGCSFSSSCCWKAFCKLSFAHWSTCFGFSFPVSVISLLMPTLMTHSITAVSKVVLLPFLVLLVVARLSFLNHFPSTPTRISLSMSGKCLADCIQHVLMMYL